MKTYSDFMRLVVDAKNVPGVRFGQAYMNTLSAIAPIHCRMIIASPVDCFYNDKLIPGFLAWIGDNWDSISEEWNS